MSKIEAIMPLTLKRAIRKLGHDINTARRRRQLTVTMMTERAGISKPTYLRVEKGDPNVSFGIYCMVLFALGEADRINDLLDISRDETGLLLDEARLPKRVRTKKQTPAAF
ncbi:MAG: hypothetical protein BWK73_11040 [Thiothrix lacustris]|jgi:DNA-binding XRE family transcriptional regulator|uniref:Uncharacterized protein n=1 Tax=Thiothrix lacustris TaxID=525917 RepID=A0A1Y1QU42_9GAMM|nr:MAG: hypothetical protein BWK73_11040 [Thiothrix lacustris]